MTEQPLRPPLSFRAALLLVTLGLLPSAPARAQVARTGTFVLLWTDPAPGSALEPRVDPVLLEDGGGMLLLDLDPEQLRAAGGAASLLRRRVAVAGEAVAGGADRPAGGDAHASMPRLRVTSLRPLEPAAGTEPGSASSALAHRYVTVLCRFPGTTDAGGARTAAAYEHWLGDAYPGMDHYWDEVSGGRIDFDGDVAGWYELPGGLALYFEDPEEGKRVKPDWGLLARDCAALADPDVDFRDVAGVNLQFNVDFGASWGGDAPLSLDGPERHFAVTWLAAWSSPSVYAHEVGHTFGLPHSSGPYEATYDSRWDVMSNGNTLWDSTLGTAIGQHTNVFHRDLLGWVTPERKWVANAFGATEAVDLEFWGVEGPGSAMVQIPLSGRTFYVAEARRQVGYDRGIPFEGVLLHEVDPDRGDRRAQVVDIDRNGDPNDAGAIWTPGETFEDPGQGVRLRVTEALGGDDGYRIELTRGWWLDVVIAGEGRVWSSTHPVAQGADGGLECTASCSPLFATPGTLVLEAEAGEGVAFAGWGGACEGSGSCRVTLGRAGEVTADFVEPLAVVSQAERPHGVVGAWYDDVLETTGGTGEVTWSVSAGALPEGMVLDPTVGALTGIPEESGDFHFSVTATSKALTATATFELSVGVPTLARQSVLDELLERGSTLTTDEARYLDITGNGNGRLDVGDVWLFLDRSGG